MDTLSLPGSNRLYVVVGGQAAFLRLLELAARLALRGPLLLLDCGNRANPLPLARMLRRLTNDPVGALQNVQVARAFTCYQVVALLEQAGQTPTPAPVLILDLLASFYDESISRTESSRLFANSLRCITRLRAFAPLVVNARPPLAAFPERASFLDTLCQHADQCWVEEPVPSPAAQQPSLFL